MKLRTNARTGLLVACLGVAAGCSRSSPGAPGGKSNPDAAAPASDAGGDDAPPAADGSAEAGLAMEAGSLAEAGPAAGGDAPSGAGASFVHPGLLHTQADFNRMATKVGNVESPWVDGWNRLIANSHASLTYTPRPQAEIHRNDGTNPDNYMIFANDVAAAYACALRWKVSGDTHYADKAVQILNAWASTLTAITWSDGHYDGYLAAGIQGYQIANAAEIMRTYAGWAAADFARFQSMMLTVFWPMVSGMFTTASSLSVYSNWDLCAMDAALAIAVLCDDREKFDAVLTYFKSGLGNGAVAQTVYYIHPGYLGQTQEAGRDQGHDTFSVSLLTVLCEMAWNQGVDLYGYDNNRVLAAAEYVAKGNLISSGTDYYTVPFATYKNASVTNTVFSTGSQGNSRPEWALIYNHYVGRRGLAAPYTEKFMRLTQPEGGGGDYGSTSGGYDQLGYGTLAFTREPVAAGAPSGLTAHSVQGSAILSWWGTASATSYTVQRAAGSGGPYTTVASGITDLLTFADQPPAAGTYFYVVTGTTASGQTAPSNEARVVTATALHTHLTFDEDAGSLAMDSTNGGHTGALVGGASRAMGKSGNALSLDGAGGYVALPAGVVADVADFTIAAWVYWNKSSTNARIFDFGDGVGHYLFLSPRMGGNVVRFAITSNLGVGEQQVSGTSALPTAQWVHVAVTLSGATATLYVNGTAVGSNASVQLAPFRLGQTTQNWLGRSQYPSDPYFNGLIDDFRIYYGALTGDEVAALWRGETP